MHAFAADLALHGSVSGCPAFLCLVQSRAILLSAGLCRIICCVCVHLWMYLIFIGFNSGFLFSYIIPVPLFVMGLISLPVFLALLFYLLCFCFLLSVVFPVFFSVVFVLLVLLSFQVHPHRRVWRAVFLEVDVGEFLVFGVGVVSK